MFHEGEIRLLDPEICTATEELSAGCQEFVEGDLNYKTQKETKSLMFDEMSSK